VKLDLPRSHPRVVGQMKLGNGMRGIEGPGHRSLGEHTPRAHESKAQLYLARSAERGCEIPTQAQLETIAGWPFRDHLRNLKPGLELRGEDGSGEGWWRGGLQGWPQLPNRGEQENYRPDRVEERAFRDGAFLSRIAMTRTNSPRESP